MRKKIAVGLCTLSMALALCSCGNKDMWDTNYTYDTAIISWPDGTVKTVEIKQWTDYSDGEQIQIIAEDGTIYLVSSYNCVLIKED